MKRRVAIGAARVYHFPPPPVSRLHLGRRTHVCVSHSPNSARSAELKLHGQRVLGGAWAAGGGAIRSRRPAASLAVGAAAAADGIWSIL
jgi:hypothetical protein